MENNTFNLGLAWFTPPPKIILIMKLITFIIFMAIMQASATGYGQKVTLNEKNKALKSVLESIKQQSGYVIFFDDSDLSSVRVSVNLNAVSVEEALNAVFKGQPFTYKVVEKNILVKEKEPSFLDKVANTVDSYFANIDVRGRVVDEQGRAIAGASVIIKSTGKGISTEVDGTFTLKNVAEGATILIKFIGYETKEVSAIREIGVIRLQVATNELDQVQVQAYGVTSRRLSTSNIASVKAEDIEKQNMSRPEITCRF